MRSDHHVVRKRLIAFEEEASALRRACGESVAAYEDRRKGLAWRRGGGESERRGRLESRKVANGMKGDGSSSE